MVPPPLSHSLPPSLSKSTRPGRLDPRVSVRNERIISKPTDPCRSFRDFLLFFIYLFIIIYSLPNTNP